MLRLPHRHAVIALLTAALLVAVFSAMVIWFRADLRTEIHQKIIERDAAVLYPVALQQVADSESDASARAADSIAPLTALLKSAHQQGMLAIAVFDRDGSTIEAVPSTQLFVELPVDDYLHLLSGTPITRYHPVFPLDQYFANVSLAQQRAPVLEVLLPLPGPVPSIPRGFVRYFIDARPLSRELATIDARIDRQTAITLLAGALVVGLIIGGAFTVVQRAQRAVAERNERLRRANFELTLAAKASAIGQITSHLIHGLQGSVQGLHEVVANREPGQSSPAWDSAAGYTARLQSLVQETIALLGDTTAGASYELTGAELAATIRSRSATAAAEKGVDLIVTNDFPGVIDSHRGTLLCLIAHNLVQNAIAATAAGRHVRVALTVANRALRLRVTDEGTGIPDSIRAHLFTPGRSGRPGGSGLGLSISQLLARQIGAEVVLVSTEPIGSMFEVTLPHGD